MVDPCSRKKKNNVAFRRVDQGISLKTWTVLKKQGKRTFMTKPNILTNDTGIFKNTNICIQAMGQGGQITQRMEIIGADHKPLMVSQEEST